MTGLSLLMTACARPAVYLLLFICLAALHVPAAPASLRSHEAEWSAEQIQCSFSRGVPALAVHVATAIQGQQQLKRI